MKKKIFSIAEAAVLILGIVMLSLVKSRFPESETAHAMLFVACHVGILFVLKTAEIIVACDKKQRKKEILNAVILLVLAVFSLCFGLVLL